MFGGTGNNNSSSTGGSAGFGFNLGGSSKPAGASTGFGSAASANNIFSTPTNTSNTGTSAAAGGGVAPKPASTAFAFGTPTASGSGTSTSLFGAAAASKPEAPKPAGGFSFGTSSSAGSSGSSLFGAGAGTQATGSAQSGAGGSSIFGTSKTATVPFGTTASAPTLTSSVPPASSSLFGATTSAPPASGSLFGTATSAPQTSGSLFGASTTLAPSSASGGLSFSGFGTSSGAESKPAAAPFSLASSAATTVTANAANPTSGTGFGGFKPATATPAVSGEATATGEKSTGALGKAPAATATTGDDAAKKDSSAELANAALRGKTLEEIAQMWTTELATQTRAFHTQANTVSYWDRALVQQGKRITGLYEATMGVEAEQAALEQSLEHMEGQQTALQALLDTYEGRIQDIVHKTTARPRGATGVAMSADEERDHVYSSAERLNSQLDELARRLTTLVEDVNAISSATPAAASASTGASDGQRADPFAQIVEILNAHLTSLEWVDSQTTQLQDRVKNAQRVYQEVASAQSALTGSYSGGGAAGAYGDDDDLAVSDRAMPTIPGAFVSGPDAPPTASSFGTPMAARRR
ncbi:FG-nucleoporin nsp1 [Coemansia sp. RSA 1933]|nr:FG-nucleoporin nsp1 [Coemansia sp. RSA 1933]